MAVLLVGLWYVQIAASKRFVKELTKPIVSHGPDSRDSGTDPGPQSLASGGEPGHVQCECLPGRTASRVSAGISARKGEPKIEKRSERMVLGRQTRYQVVSNMVEQAERLDAGADFAESDQFQQHYEKRLALPFPVLTNLAYPQVARFLENSAKSPGLELEIQPTRTYPYKTAAAHLLGYVQRSDGIR